jgi:hypothetical protein
MRELRRCLDSTRPIESTSATRPRRARRLSRIEWSVEGGGALLQLVRSSSGAGIGAGDCSDRRATASSACKPPPIGRPASTSATLATAMQDRGSVAQSTAMAGDAAAGRAIGDMQGVDGRCREASRRTKAELGIHCARRGCSCAPPSERRGFGPTVNALESSTGVGVGSPTLGPSAAACQR